MKAARGGVGAPPVGRRASPRARAALAIAATALVCAGLLAAPPVGRGVRAAAKRALGWGATWRRAALRPPEQAPGGPALSQVGYGPSMRKAFTAARPFRSFRVVREGDGAVAYSGGPPARSVPAEVAFGPGRRAWIGDFTPLAAPGRYRVIADDGSASLPFDVGPEVFDASVRAVQRWFYYQRAFTAIDAAHAEGPWTHPSDADRAPPGVRKGWHDAGDLSIYSASANAALFWLLEAWSDFAPASDDTGIPESGNGIPDLLDEARWGLEWLLSVQAPSGAFLNATCLERYGPYGTGSPERVAPYVNGEPGTLATARAAGTLAYASSIYRPFDAGFAARCLAAATAGYRYLRAHWTEASDGPTCPALRRDGDQEVLRHARMYAAAGMLLATGDPSFREDFDATFEPVRQDPDFHHLNGLAALLYLRAGAGDPGRKAELRRSLALLADRARSDGALHPFGWATRLQWGSIAAGFYRTDTSSAKACLASSGRATEDCEQALANVHYMLGRNSLRFCYVSGLPGVSHGRRGAFHRWLAALAATPRLFPGMVAGGPNPAPDPNDLSLPHARPAPIWGYFGDPAFPRDEKTPVDGRYTDNDSWSTNEVAVDWQAVTLYALYLAQRLARGDAAR